MVSRSSSIRCHEGVETPGKEWWEWPECGWFLAQPWERVDGTQDGTVYSWGGVCKRHGRVSDST